MVMIRWIVFLFVLGAVTDEIAFGQEVPSINNDPAVLQEFDSVTNAAKLSSYMKCTLKTRTSRELREFSCDEN